MVEFRSLADESLDNLHAVFLDAFSSYEVPFNLSLSKLEEMLTTRSYSAEHSIGLYADGELAGFTLTGIRILDSSVFAYDVATGIAKRHQGKGYAGRMIQAVQEFLSALNVNVFQLEVLENNDAARRVYEKAGFRVTRRFICFEIDRSIIAPVKPEIIPPDSLAIIDESDFNSFIPSWQNTLISYRNNINQQVLVGLLDNHGAVTGYGIVNPDTGSIMQIGTQPGTGREERLSRVLGSISAVTQTESLRIANVEENSWLATQLRAAGFEETVAQFEMKYFFNS